MDCCFMCKNKIINIDTFVSYVHKDRPYGGYSKNSYPRYMCSQTCLDKYNKNNRCNLCHVVIYDWSLIKQHTDDFLYCDDEDQCNVGTDTCYNIVLNQK